MYGENIGVPVQVYMYMYVVHVYTCTSTQEFRPVDSDRHYLLCTVRKCTCTNMYM